MDLRHAPSPADLVPNIDRLFDRSAEKIRAIESTWRLEDGAPVFTIGGRYAARGWTEWTQGFQIGSAILQFDATGDRAFLESGRRTPSSGWRRTSVTSACTTTDSTTSARTAISGASRARAASTRATGRCGSTSSRSRRAAPFKPDAGRAMPDGGFIHSFNGAHSLFVDTIRSLRALALSHQLGHRLSDEQDAQVNLLERLLQHARATADYSVYYGRGPRRVRRARPRRARVPVQCGQRHVPRPEHAAGLLALQHVDARAGLGDARICRATRVSRDASGPTR